jgi:hypothetical protein
MKYLFVIGAALLMAVGAGAQTRSVTNEDLSRYAQQREAADREYRENYARRGMPSPEELARQRTEAALATREYADRIRAQEAEIQSAAAAQAAAMRQMSSPVIVVNGQGGYDTGYFLSGGYYNGRNYGRGTTFGGGIRQYAQRGYYAGGQFWPTGSATPSRPIFSSGARPIISRGPRR